MNVAFCSSDLYAKCTGIAIYSLLVNNKELETLTIYLFTTDMSDKNRKRISDLCECYNRTIHIIDIEDVLKEGQKELGLEDFKGGLQTYARAMANVIVPKDVERILFVDSDIVFNGSIMELEKFDIFDTIVYGVPEIMLMTKDVCHEDEMLLNQCEYYINYGVVLINLKYWREIDGDKLIRTSIKEWGRPFKIAEQSILNYSFRHYTKALPPKYNYYTILHGVSYDKLLKWYPRRTVFTRSELDEAVRYPVIIHFVGDYFNRPWYKDNICRAQEIYLKYYKESPWGNEALEEKPNDISLPFFIYYQVLIWARNKGHDDFYFYLRYIIIEWIREKIPKIETIKRKKQN